jgi:hypothetical protein
MIGEALVKLLAAEWRKLGVLVINSDSSKSVRTNSNELWCPKCGYTGNMSRNRSSPPRPNEHVPLSLSKEHIEERIVMSFVECYQVVIDADRRRVAIALHQ